MTTFGPSCVVRMIAPRPVLDVVNLIPILLCHNNILLCDIAARVAALTAPVSRAYISMPTDHQSDEWPYGRPDNTSGAATPADMTRETTPNRITLRPTPGSPRGPPPDNRPTNCSGRT